MKTIQTLFLISSLAIATTFPVVANEVCYSDLKDNVEGFAKEQGKLLNDLSAKYEASADPYTEEVTYNNMKMPIAAALIIESNKFGLLADKNLTVQVDKAKECAGKTALVRGVYDFARELAGITTILPDRATNIDFEQIRRGKILGGDNSLVNKGLRDAENLLNPAKWKVK